MLQSGPESRRREWISSLQIIIRLGLGVTPRRKRTLPPAADSLMRHQYSLRAEVPVLVKLKTMGESEWARGHQSGWARGHPLSPIHARPGELRERRTIVRTRRLGSLP